MTETTEPTSRRGGSQKKLTVQSVTTALEAVGGIMTAAAHYLGVDRSTVYRFINENPELKDVRADIEDQTKDMAEGKIVTAIKNGEMDTVRWYADRKMRDRGYGHQAKVEGPGKDGAFRHEVATIDPSKMSTEALRELRAATLDQDAADAE